MKNQRVFFAIVIAVILVLTVYVITGLMNKANAPQKTGDVVSVPQYQKREMQKNQTGQEQQENKSENEDEDVKAIEEELNSVDENQSFGEDNLSDENVGL